MYQQTSQRKTEGWAAKKPNVDNYYCHSGTTCFRHTTKLRNIVISEQV